MKANKSVARGWAFLMYLGCALLWLFSSSASAADAAGVILALSGKVEIQRGAEKRTPAARAEIFSGDTIVTNEGQVQVRFSDGTMLTLYRDTRFAVDDYRFGKGKDDRAKFSLVNGLMHTLTGQMDKQNYQVKTRLANLGVRGTEYSVQLGAALHVSVDQGRVSIANAGGTLEVGPGGSAMVTAVNSMPRPTAGKIDLRGGGPGGRGGGTGGNPGGGPGGGAPPPPPGGGGGGTPGGAPTGGGTGAPPPPPPGTQKF